MLERLVLKSRIERTNQRVKWTSRVRNMKKALSFNSICFVSVQHLSQAKTDEAVFCVLFFDLGWGQPRLVLTTFLYYLPSFAAGTRAYL